MDKIKLLLSIGVIALFTFLVSSTISKGEGNVYIKTESKAVSNTGQNTGGENIETGDASAKSSSKIEVDGEGTISGWLEVEVNGEKKSQEIKDAGEYQLKLDKEGEVKEELKKEEVESQNLPEVLSAAVTKNEILRRFFSFVFDIFQRFF